MPRAFYQIRAQIGLRIPFGIGRKLTRRCKQPLPIRHRPAHAHEKWHGGVLVGLLHRFDFLHEIRIHCRHVLVGHDGIRWVRHGRIQRRTIAAHTVFHRIAELFQAVFAYACFRVGGDVGGVNRAHWGLHRQAACIGFATWHAVASKAVGALSHVFASGHHIGILLTRRLYSLCAR